jgi:hypothetical protein
MADKKPIDMEQFEKIKKRDDQIKQNFSKRDLLNKEFEKMFFMENEPKTGSGWENSDIRETRSTSSRDSVTGVHRMVSTSKIQFTVECDQPYKDKIEGALGKWWAASSAVQLAEPENDMALSGILFSDVGVSVDKVEDILEYAPTYEHERLKEILEETPFLFETVPGQTSYPVFGRFGMIEWLGENEMTGKEIKERWSVTDLEDNMKYTLRDHYDMVWRCVYLSEKNDPIVLDQHGLPTIPKFCAVAGGSNLFHEEEKKRQPFLFGMHKGKLDLREDETMTALFTSIATRGPGPIYMIDPTSVGNGKVEVHMQGAFRYVMAKGNPVDDKAFDSALIDALNKLKELKQQTTINDQTLGENIESGTPFSGYAMASQNGRIPTLPIQSSREKVIHDASVAALRWFKRENIKWDGLKATEIPDNFKASMLKVKLEVDLPQDDVRNAQAVSQLANANVPLTNERIHNMLQIKDSNKETANWMSEQATIEAFKQGLPTMMQEMLGMFSQPNTNTDTVPTTTTSQPEAIDATRVAMPGGATAAASGAEATPATEPLQQVNRGRA